MSGPDWLVWVYLAEANGCLKTDHWKWTQKLTDCPFGPRGPVAPWGPGGPRGPGKPGAPEIPGAPYETTQVRVRVRVRDSIRFLILCCFERIELSQSHRFETGMMLRWTMKKWIAITLSLVLFICRCTYHWSFGSGEAISPGVTLQIEREHTVRETRSRSYSSLTC